MSLNRPQNKNNWQTAQDKLADESGLAIVVTDENSPALAKSNNNSMCQILYNSEEFAPECAKYCGKAFERATEAEKTVGYKCYAGLNCLAVPFKKEDKRLVVIVGRAFLKADDYRKATERSISGDWQKFPPASFFENALLSNSIQDLEACANRLENLSDDVRNALFQIKPEEARASVENSVENLSEKTEESFQTNVVTETIGQTQNLIQQKSVVSERITSETVTRRSLFTSLLDLSYKQACLSILRFLTKRYSIFDLAWLERKDNHFEIVLRSEKFKEQEIQISVLADDAHLLEAVNKETSLELREQQTEDGNVEPQMIQLFPIVVGDRVQSAIIVGDNIGDTKTKRHIVRLCQTVSSQLEILRLREELSRRGLLEQAVRKFNESIKDIDGDNFWSELIQISAELMKSERSSLLILDEKSDALVAKAAIGLRTDIIKNEKVNLGGKIAKDVLKSGKPFIAKDIKKVESFPASSDWNYKTDSFISYPITIGNRKIGVLNVTDKANGGSYSDFDLELLDAIVPQLGILIDRVALKRKAGEFEQLSVTDPLTGLLNRRYLEERLAEEIKRSKRYGYPMSFMMVDVDDFKTYNDNFSHPEGDKALQIVGQCLKETLRGADVAARYGGEEFSILLPQTNLEEAAAIAERIRERIESADFPKRQVTVSIGIASCTENLSTAPKLITAADFALYEAKRRGRNNVQIYKDAAENGNKK